MNSSSAFFLFAQERAVKLDPFGAAQGMGLIAGSVDEHRDPESFKLSFHVGGMADHARLYGQGAVLFEYQLVIRLGVLARVEDISLFHGFARVVDVPAVGVGAGKTDGVKTVQAVEKAHHGSGRKVDVLHRLLQDGYIVGDLGRDLRSFGDDEETSAVMDGNELQTALVFLDGKLMGEGKLRFRNGLHTDAACGLCVPAGSNGYEH